MLYEKILLEGLVYGHPTERKRKKDKITNVAHGGIQTRSLLIMKSVLKMGVLIKYFFAEPN